MLTVSLGPEEDVLAEPGAMVAQQGVALRTRISGGPLEGFQRMLGGESFFLNRFTGGPEGGWVMLAPRSPGDIQEFSLGPGSELLVQSGSFLACWGPVELDQKFQGLRGLFSREGLFFLRASLESEASGPASVFFNAYGALREIVLEPDGELVVDTGHLVAFTGGVDYSIGRVGGLTSIVGGREGLVMRLRGAGSVWIQTRNLLSFVEWMSSILQGRSVGKG